MRGGTHALAGITIALVTAVPAPPLQLLGVAIAGAIGALMPDLDHPQAALSRRVWIASASLRMVVSHRGATHSLLAFVGALILTAVSPAHWQHIVASAAVGYCSHIILDALTISGVPLLWPWGRRFSLLSLRTGGTIERLFALAMAAGLFIWGAGQT
jgi:inner membrane protein